MPSGKPDRRAGRHGRLRARKERCSALERVDEIGRRLRLRYPTIFTLADGRKITVKNGWRGLPEEQGFLRGVQAAACEQFSTALAPGSNVFHYDHIHADLMRRRDGRRACNPSAVSGEAVAARAGARYGARRGGEPAVTGSLAPRRYAAPAGRYRADEEERRERALPLAQPGADGEDD